MFNQDIADVAARLTSGALQSGKLPVDAEHVAEYYMKLYDRLTEHVAERQKARASQPLKPVNRISEDPNEAW